MKIVLTYGTFDLFHVGHVRLLKRLSKLGDKLIVGVSTDEFNFKKGKKSIFSYEERAEIVLSCRSVAEVFPEDDWAQKRSDIKRFGADVFAMGSDWAGKFDELADIVEVVYFPRTEGISTTTVKSLVSALHQDKVAELQHVASRMTQLINAL